MKITTAQHAAIMTYALEQSYDAERIVKDLMVKHPLIFLKLVSKDEPVVVTDTPTAAEEPTNSFAPPSRAVSTEHLRLAEEVGDIFTLQGKVEGILRLRAVLGIDLRTAKAILDCAGLTEPCYSAYDIPSCYYGLVETINQRMNCANWSAKSA